MDAKILFFLVALVVYSLLTFDHGIQLVIKQIVNIVFSVFVFYYVLCFEEFDVEKVFRKYIYFSKIVVLLGFLQVLLYSFELLDIHVGHFLTDVFQFLKTSDISFRLQSITQEPSYLAFVLAPVVFLALYNLISGTTIYIDRTWSFLFVVAYLLTFSMVAYTGLTFIVLIIFFRRLTVRKLVIFLVVVTGIFSFGILSYTIIPSIKLRVNETLEGIKDGIVENGNYKSVNWTTYAILTNLYVTENSIRDHPLTGTGLGTYELSYDYYLPQELRAYATVNREEANSMALRLLTETGIIGFLVFCFVLFRCKVNVPSDFPEEQGFLWIVNNGILVMFLLFLIRNGNYTMHGRMLFLLLYYYTFQEVRKISLRKVDHIEPTISS
jgi:O-antigen ligase